MSLLENKPLEVLSTEAAWPDIPFSSLTLPVPTDKTHRGQEWEVGTSVGRNRDHIDEKGQGTGELRRGVVRFRVYFEAESGEDFLKDWM